MSIISKALAKFKNDKAGAALVEYSLLIGFITVAAVGVIILLGPWITLQWQKLATALSLG